MNLHFHMFRFMAVSFLIYFVYNAYQYSIVYSLLDTLLMWASVVVATPLPSAALLLSFPVKVFFDIPMYISQIIASILSILLLFVFMKHTPEFVMKIWKKQLYSIFAISIACSVLLSELLDLFYNYYVGKKINVYYVLCITLLSGILLYLYKMKINS